MAKRDDSKVAGGHARSRALTPEQRKAIAQKAAKTRWAGKLPHATHEGVIEIADTKVECAVLEGGEMRVVSTDDFADLLRSLFGGEGNDAVDLDRVLEIDLGDRSGGEPDDEDPLAQLEVFQKDGKTMTRLTTRDGAALAPSGDAGKPIQFFYAKSGEVSQGVSMDVVVDIVAAHASGGAQSRKAKDALHIRAGLQIGDQSLEILIDTATGFHRDSAADEACRIIEAHVPEAVKAWVKTFRMDFYEELFRLHGRGLDAGDPPDEAEIAHVATLLFDGRIADDLLAELQDSAPKTPKGRKKLINGYRLDPDLGHRKLQEYLASIVTIMKLSDDLAQFEMLLARVDPVAGERR